MISLSVAFVMFLYRSRERSAFLSHEQFWQNLRGELVSVYIPLQPLPRLPSLSRYSHG